MTSSQYFIYIMTNKTNTTLYVGMTNNLVKRVHEHKRGIGSKFTEKYQLIKLVYYEMFSTPIDAILREKQIKAGSRSKKIELIKTKNTLWKDLYKDIQ